ncbi:hypothetical protein ACFO1B_51985 [Dactylosporangium siamense]|uniref:Uncharacterized protein n=1 Tax=Dactylosporangium siamense TaxID=685454 RepID=A0A919PY22_9ACTN|nr:hypothetical protein [Dactylosporangium siamense]GIG52501.1 hypothetical protein Dsi01nite_105420 [Dactylosporangium siamense]
MARRQRAEAARTAADFHERAALLTVGTAGAVPTVATGLADSTTPSREQRRVALVHAGANTSYARQALRAAQREAAPEPALP